MNLDYITNESNVLDPFIPVTDGIIEFDKLSQNYKETYFYIEFYDSDKQTIVTPTAGIVSFTGSPMGNVFMDPSYGGVIDATAVSHTMKADYNIPFFETVIKSVRINFSGVVGASYCKILFAQYQ